VVLTAPTLPKVAGRLLILVGFLPDKEGYCGSNQGGRAAAGVKTSLRPERLAMGKKQLNFKDFLRERGEDSLVTEDPVDTGNILREVKMGLSAMAALTVLVVILFHDDGMGKKVEKAQNGAESVQFTIHPSAPDAVVAVPSPNVSQAVVHQDASPVKQDSPEIAQIGLPRPVTPPAPALQDCRSGDNTANTTGPAAPVQKDKVYTVSAGDTLSGIAMKLCGSKKHVKKLAEFNHISVDDPIRIGQELKIPVVAAPEQPATGKTVKEVSKEPVKSPAQKAKPAVSKPVESQRFDNPRPREIPFI
jgi:LysM repeat protein